MVNLQDVWAARARIDRYIHHTRTIYSTNLSGLFGAEICLKCENLQKTGSFKARGAFNHIAALSGPKKQGVVCYSSGNHSQAVGYAASVFGVDSWLVMPEYTSSLKVECSKSYGTHTILYGKSSREAFQKALEIQREYSLDYLDPGEDELLVAGQGTIGLEILDAVPDADTVYVPVGGGGMAAGIAVAVKELSPKTKLICVEPENANAMYKSLKAGKISTIQRIPSIADGLGGTVPCTLPYEILKKYADDIITVSEKEIAQATKLVIQRTKLFAEPSGATALAGLLSRRSAYGQKNVCVVSGGNAAPETIADIVSGRYS